MTMFAQAPALGSEKFGATLCPVAEEFDRINQTDITMAVWSGAHAAYLGGHRDSQDLDIWVDDNDLPELTSHFPEADIVDTHDRYMVRPCGRLMEFMGRMTVHTEDGAFDIRLSGNAADRIRYHLVDNRWIPFAAPEDTMLLKSWLARGSEVGKHDINDIAAIASHTAIDRSYLWNRIEETGSIHRILRVPLMAAILLNY